MIIVSILAFSHPNVLMNMQFVAWVFSFTVKGPL